MPEEEFITISIYKKDWEILISDMNKNETFRDRIHKLVDSQPGLKEPFRALGTRENGIQPFKKGSLKEVKEDV